MCSGGSGEDQDVGGGGVLRGGERALVGGRPEPLVWDSEGAHCGTMTTNAVPGVYWSCMTLNTESGSMLIRQTERMVGRSDFHGHCSCVTIQYRTQEMLPRQM